MSLPSEVNPHLLASGSSIPSNAISRSVRISQSRTTNFRRTYSVSRTSTTTGTISCWIKKCGSTQQTICSGYDGTSPNSFIWYIVGDMMSIDFGGSGQNTTKLNQYFRDPTAWMHVVLVFDTSSATTTITGSSTDRIRLYINGVQVTSFNSTSVPSQGASFQFALSNSNNKIASDWNNGSYFDGYLSEFYYVDGQALTPTSFGSTDATTGVWNPIRYTGTYGTNGFYLNFSDNSAATAAAIGKDSSGNGNNWTPTNISVTAGATNDSLLDSPTNYGTDTGVGGEVRGNYCTLNPIDKSSGITLSNGNLTITGGSNVTAKSTFFVSSGKWYCELVATTFSGNMILGITSILADIGYYIGQNVYGYGYASNAVKWNNGSQTAYGASWGVNDVIGIAFDADAGTLVFYKNGASQGTAFTGITGSYSISVSTGTGSTAQINFGQRAFAYTAPSGYKALCTQNLPTPTINNGANHMAATTYTGTGTSLTVSNAVNGVSFQPDFVWVKNRGTASTDHGLFDTVRGATKRLASNLTSAETTEVNSLTAFTSTGFTVGATQDFNQNGVGLVGWQWKGGTAVTNTSGTISSQVSANPTAGFSIVAYTGNGVNSATVGHGLGVTPSMIITKNRDIGTAAYSWYTNHVSLGAGQVELESTLASNNPSTVFSNGGLAPASSWTSNVFSFVAGNGNTTNNVNNNGSKFIAYCFASIAGYSAFGSYIGNGSTDGPFVYCGFRPRFVLMKISSSATHWVIIDSSRDPYNVASSRQSPNLALSDATLSDPTCDFLSNGFKVRTTNATSNQSGDTYIYAAFAENPFSIARAR